MQIIELQIVFICYFYIYVNSLQCVRPFVPLRTSRIFYHKKTMQLRFSESDDSELSKIDVNSGIKDLANIRSPIELNAIIESLPTEEKYSFLIQAYSTKIIESTESERNETLLADLNNLYNEMIRLELKPTEKTTQSLIDATASYCDCNKLAYSLRQASEGNQSTSPSFSSSFYYNLIKEKLSKCME